MDETDRTGWVVVVADAEQQQRRLRSMLQSELSVTVTSLPPDADFDDRLDAVSHREAIRQLDGVVVALDRPTAVRSTLERIHDELPDVPTIVAPPEGSERLATAAIRAGASEYVADGESTIARITELVRSEPEAESTIEATDQQVVGNGRLHRILATELPDEAYIIDESGRYLEAKTRPSSKQLYDLPAAELIGSRLREVFPPAEGQRLQECVERAIRTDSVQSIEYDARTAEGVRQYEARVVPVEESIDSQRIVVWLARDITERAQRVEKLRNRRDRLETLNRINAVIREVIETLVEAPTRDAIERQVCDQLVDSDLYCGSWIVEQTAGQHLTYRLGAGEAKRVLDVVSELDPDQQPTLTRAIETTQVQAISGLSDAAELPESLQAAADDDGVESLIAVPISHEQTTYGVLFVTAGREDAFSEREQAEFRLLGETIGFTIRAVKNRQLLFADTIVELEFRIHGGNTFSFDLSEEYDCRCMLEWAGTTAQGRSFQFVTIEGLDAETALEEARAHESLDNCRLVHDGTHRCTIELQLSQSGVRALANHGATIREVTVEDGVGSCLVEVPQDANVREIAQALTAVYENTDLLARREIDRPVRTAAERRARILDELTDRQLTTLRLAYYSGFFEWPRESTGEEVADAMDVSPPTMHQHLRKGLATILGELFEDEESK